MTGTRGPASTVGETGTTGGTQRSGRRWAPGRAVAAAVALAALGTGCASEADPSGESDVVTGAVDFKATGQFLASASQRSSAEPHRSDASVSMEVVERGQPFSFDAQLMTGAQDGDRYEIHMDMSEWVSQIGQAQGGTGPPPGTDLTMDTAGDAETLYIRAPMYATLAEQAPAMGTGPVGELAELGDDWGRVDLTALGDLSLVDLQSAAGGPGGSDPRVILDAVAGAGDVDPLGTDQTGGVGVNGLGASLSLRDLLDAQGVDAEAFIDQMGANTAGLDQRERALSSEMMDAVFRTDVPFQVWVDGDGYVRRVSYEIDNLAIMREVGRSVPPGLETLVVRQTMDFRDYGDESIEIEFPSDAVDATDIYRRMLEAGRAGSS